MAQRILVPIFMFASQCSMVVSTGDSCNDVMTGRIFDQANDLMMLQVKATDKRWDVVNEIDFEAVGSGCCSGARDEKSGKLWSGWLKTFTDCKAKCREFTNCGTIEYGWLGNPEWCFIWNDAQLCTTLDVGEGKCGSKSDGVHSYRFTKSKSAVVAAEQQAKMAEQQAEAERQSAHDAALKAKEAVAAAEAAEYEAVEVAAKLAASDAKAKAGLAKEKTKLERALSEEAATKEKEADAAEKLSQKRNAQEQHAARRARQAQRLADEAEEEAHQQRALAEEAMQQLEAAQDKAKNATERAADEKVVAQQAGVAMKEAIREDLVAAKEAEKALKAAEEKRQKMEDLEFEDSMNSLKGNTENSAKAALGNSGHVQATGDQAHLHEKHDAAARSALEDEEYDNSEPVVMEYTPDFDEKLREYFHGMTEEGAQHDFKIVDKNGKNIYDYKDRPGKDSFPITIKHKVRKHNTENKPFEEVNSGTSASNMKFKSNEASVKIHEGHKSNFDRDEKQKTRKQDREHVESELKDEQKTELKDEQNKMRTSKTGTSTHRDSEVHVRR